MPAVAGQGLRVRAAPDQGLHDVRAEPAGGAGTRTATAEKPVLELFDLVG